MDTPKTLKKGLGLHNLESSIFCPKYEKPLRKAFYNGVALLLISACSVFAWGSFIILEPFLKPLFWALLCGSVLHPLKYKLSTHFKTWIILAEDTDFKLPLVVSILSFPLRISLELSEFIGDSICKHWKKIIVGVLFMCVSGVIYNYTPQILICLSWKILKVLVTATMFVTELFKSSTLVVTLVLGFLIALTMCWDQKYENNFIKISYAVWFAVSAHIASYFYYIEIPTFAFFQLLFIFGFFLSNQESTLKSDDSVVGSVLCAEGEQDAKVNTVKAPPCDLTVIQSPLASKPLVCPPDTVQLLLHQVRWYTSDNTSDYYIYWVSVACVITLILQSGWIPYVLALLFLVYIIRHLCKSFGVTDFVHSKYCLFMDWISEWYFVRKNVLIPAPILCLNTMFSEVRSRLLSILKDSSDSAATVIVILALLFVVIFGSTFLVIQAYTEGMYMMKVGGSVINQTVVHNPELTQLLPEGLEQQLNSVLNNAYIYGRQAISKFVRNMLSEVSEEKALEVEDRVLDLWDRVYQAWMMSAIEKKTTIGPKVTSSAVYQTWDNFIDIVHRTPELVSMRAVTDWAQNNMVMLTSGLESVWELIRGNASLVLSAFLTVFTVVFTHSFAVLNFCISMIVFLTALFYLLSSSRQLYKPVELITAISPVFGKRLAFAMENAVNEVLTASFKLAVFYGMWTWLIHNLFQMNIVYIPSVLAAMLAVVPALGTYWACLPAVLDLWLAQGKKFHAITLAVCQFLPTLFVDATIYTEINEGHPYLTGLSVAGGLFCMGMEGAIIGPLILCCLYVVVSMSSAIMQDATTPSATTPSLASPRRSLI